MTKGRTAQAFTVDTSALTSAPALTPALALARLSRVGWFALGWVAVSFGSLGIIVPGLPTTIFFIGAACCFGRCSPRLERWVLHLPAIGPMVRDHRAGLGMPRRAKKIALTVMWTAITLSSVALRSQPLVVGVVVLLGTIGTAYMLSRVPTRERVLAQRASATA